MRRRRNRRSRTLVLAGVAAAAAATVAAASPLGAIANAQISAAGSSVPRCDTHGFTVAYTTAGATIASVTVGSISDADCEGATLHVTITDANGNGIAQASPQIVAPDADGADGTVTLAFADEPAAADAAGVEISTVDA